MHLRGHKRNESAGAVEPFGGVQKYFGCETNPVGNRCSNYRCRSGEHRPGENLSPRHIVRGQGEKPLRRVLRNYPPCFAEPDEGQSAKNLSVARADARSARTLNAVCLGEPVDPEVPTTSARDSGPSVCPSGF